ncbi:MAG: hypothetical protein RJS97_00345 [Parvibaculaceae bacterium]
MTEEKPFFLTKNSGLRFAGPEDDLLHPEKNALVSGDTVTETQFFGFSIPEAQIHAMCYLWHHPNLGVVTGGVWAWKGIKRNAVHSELIDIRTFMNDSPLKKDLHHFVLDNSYSVRIIEPLKTFHLKYSDAAREHQLDLTIEAVSPAVLFADGNHLEQAMRVTGKAKIRGESFDVDCYTVRDRSWGKSRPETTMTTPPMSWATAVFNDNFSLNCNVLDQADQNKELAGSSFDVPVERSLLGGWVWKDGEIAEISSARKYVQRAPESYIPLRVELGLIDTLGRTFELTGDLVASCPWETWANVNMSISLMKWRCGELEAYGDCQEAFWSDYYNFRDKAKR